MSKAQQIDWRHCEFMHVKDAARILGYSSSYVRRLVFEGALLAVRPALSGPILITVASMRSFVDGLEPITFPPTRTRPVLAYSNL